MKITFLTASALVAALAMPVGAYAQQSQPQGGQAQTRTTASHAKISHRWMKRLGNLNLSGDQQQRIQSMIDRYSQAHPQGSPRDPAAAHELRRQIMGTLSSGQQNQFQQEIQQRRAQSQQRRGQMQQQGQPQDQQQDQQQQYQQPQYGDPRNQQPQYGEPQAQQPQDQRSPDQGGPDQGPPPGQGPPDQGGPDQGPPPGQGPPNQQPAG